MADQKRAAQRKIAQPRRGDVWLVAFDPTVGAEIRKTRPAVIIQNDVGNRVSGTTIVAAVSSQADGDLYPFEVAVTTREGGLAATSIILLNQIRTVDRRRLLRKLGALQVETMQRVDRALIISLGLIDF